jgi:2-methylcitrate dehydratase PrpD
MSEVTKTVADFIAKAKYDDLPPEVVDKVKNILLDSIGCALGGYVTEKGKIVGAFIRELGGNPQATIIGNGRTSAVNAAFANGELINAMDMDCMAGSAHVIPYVLPPCLALAEMSHGSGKDLLLAAALAVEIGGRVGASLLQMRKPIQEPPYYETSPRYGFSTAVFGGTAGGCKILQMGPDKIVSALGIAGASTPVPGSAHFQHFKGPLPMVKYNSWAGWVSQLGTVSPLIANKGFTGSKYLRRRIGLLANVWITSIPERNGS